MKILSGWISFLLLLSLGHFVSAGPPPPPPSTGTLSGQLLDTDGAPFGLGVASFFNVDNGLPVDNGIVRRVPDLVVRLGQDGFFKAELPAGSYYIGALQREIGKGPGPPRAGEKFIFAQEKGTMQVFTVKTGQVVEAGSVTGKAPDLSSQAGAYFIVEGTVTHQDGQPFTGAIVTAKNNPALPRPLFMASPTGPDGKYRLKLQPGMEYYLVALESLRGGRPLPGNFIGSYGGSSPAPDPDKDTPTPPVAAGRKDNYAAGTVIMGQAGEIIKKIDIQMYRVPDPKEVRDKMLNKSKAQQTPQPDSNAK